MGDLDDLQDLPLPEPSTYCNRCLRPFLDDDVTIPDDGTRSHFVCDRVAIEALRRADASVHRSGRPKNVDFLRGLGIKTLRRRPST
jgi:hypothetical protein